MKKFSIFTAAALAAISLTACSNQAEPIKNPSGTQSVNSENSSENITSADIENIKKDYENNGAVFYDAKIVDIDSDGENEILALTAKANSRNFDVLSKSEDGIILESSFGFGQVDFIDKIDLKNSEIDGEKVWLFSFSYDGGTMKADEVLSAVKKTGSGYAVEHLLSRGTIEYSDIAEPFSKEFFRKGWSKYDIGMDNDYGDITVEEYEDLYKNYTGVSV